MAFPLCTEAENGWLPPYHPTPQTCLPSPVSAEPSSEDWGLSNYLERMNQGPGMITNIYNTHCETTSLCYSVPSHVSRPVSACNMEKRISPRRAAKKGRAACAQRLLAHKTRQIKRKLRRVPLHKTLRTRLESSNTQEKFPAKTHRERTPGATNTLQPQPVVWR